MAILEKRKKKTLLLIAGLASAILALSHAIDLQMGHPMYGLLDPVFPFIKGRVLYSFLTLFLVQYSIMCFSGGFFAKNERYCSACALFLLLSIIWYRISLSILDITECRCLGILGRAFSLTQTQERVIRTLLLIALCAPAIFVFSRKLSGFGAVRKVRMGLQILVFFATMLTIRSEETINIIGYYSLQAQNPISSKSYKDLSSKGTFGVQISKDCYSITITNSENGWIAGQFFDGQTLCYYDVPSSGPDAAMLFVDNCNWMLGGPRDNIPTYLIWLMYGNQQKTVEKVDEQNRPLPWDQPRYNITAYGYRWEFKWINKGDFLQSAYVRRDASLDLDNYQAELMRPTMLFPVKFDQQRQRRIDLENCRKVIPGGLLAGEYQCESITNIHKSDLPIEGVLKVYFHDAGVSAGTNYAFPYLTAKASVKTIVVMDSPMQVPFKNNYSFPITTLDTRSRAITNNRYFEGALYKLLPGETIHLVNHPDSLAQRKFALSNGPEVRWDGETSIHKYLWLPFGFIMLGLVAWLRQPIENKQNRNQKNELKG